jgi:FkbM family methyltransferase
LDSGWDARGAALAQAAWKHAFAAPVERISAPILGVPLRLINTATGGAFWRRFERQQWEANTLRVFARMIDARTTVVDFGTWIGPTMLFHAFLSRRSIGLEGDPWAYVLMRHNLALNVGAHPQLLQKVILQPGCVGVAQERANFSSAAPGNSCSGIMSNASRARCGALTTRWSVQCYELPVVFRHYGIRVERETFIKIDIESFECYLLPRIAAWFLAPNVTSKPTIYVAMHSHIAPCSAAQYGAIGRLVRAYRHYFTSSGGPVFAGDGRLVALTTEIVMSDAEGPW